MDFLFASIIWFAFCLHAFDPTLEKIDREYMWCVYFGDLLYTLKVPIYFNNAVEQKSWFKNISYASTSSD